MDVREERRQSRDGDIVRQEIEFRNSPPDLGFRGKLVGPNQSLCAALVCLLLNINIPWTQ